MDHSPYVALPTSTFTIRLLQIHPSAERTSPIACSLITYPLAARTSGAHLFEALSYVWGSHDDQRDIFIDSDDASPLRVEVTRNLHLALVHLRDPVFERVIWVDAICINQKDEKEKAHQVASMAMIYGLAQRVVVWLGEESEDSALAFRELNEANLRVHMEEQRRIRTLAGEECEQDFLPEKKSLDGGDIGNDAAQRQRACLALLNRPYFRRIWIQQELAASRSILFMCGDSQCEGDIFRESIAFNRFDETNITKTHPHTLRWLLRASSTRQCLKGGASLLLRPLGDLVDMFRDYEASDLRDKVYALLGLCSDNILASGLEPDYSIDWATLFTRLGKVVFGEKAFVSAHHIKQLMYTRVSGFMLGEVEKVESNEFWSDIQTINIVSLETRRHLDESNRWNVRCNIRKSPHTVKRNDLVLLTEETRKIVVVRPEQCYFRVIMITDSILADLLHGDTGATWYPFLRCMDTFAMTFGLIWDWHEEHLENKSDSLLLTNNECHVDIPNPQLDSFLRVMALLDTAQTLENCGAYQLAFELLGKDLQSYIHVHGLESLVPSNIPARLDQVQKMVSKQQKAHDLISKKNYFKSPSFCCAMIDLAGETHPDPYSEDSIVTPYSQMWARFASMSMCMRDTEAMMTAALVHMQMDHFGVLENFAEESLRVNQDVLVLLASGPPNTLRTIVRWAKRVRGRITNLANIIEACANVGHPSKLALETMVTGLVSDNPHKLIIQIEVIEVALSRFSKQWDTSFILSVLLGALPDDVEISEQVFRLVFAAGRWAPNLMEVLLKRTEQSNKILRNVLVEEARRGSECLEVFAVLIEHFGTRIVGTEEVLMAALDDKKVKNAGLVSLLAYTKLVEVSDAVLDKAERVGHGYTMYVLSGLRENRRVTQDDLETTAEDEDIVDYTNMLTLMRERRAEFEITEKVIETAIPEIYVCKGKSSLPLLLNEAEEDVLKRCLQNANLPIHLAVHGAGDTLATLHRRTPIAGIEGLLHFSQLNNFTNSRTPLVLSDQQRQQAGEEKLEALWAWSHNHQSTLARVVFRTCEKNLLQYGRAVPCVDLKNFPEIVDQIRSSLFEVI